MTKQPMLIPQIYVDLDDVLAQTLKAFSQLCNKSYSKSIGFEDIHSFDLRASFDLSDSEHTEFMELAHEHEFLVEAIDPVPGVHDVLSDWQTYGAHVTVVTGRPISTYDATLQWLRRHAIPFNALRFLKKYKHNEIHSAYRKALHIRTLRQANFLFAVEDNPKMADYLTKCGIAPVFVPLKPWNRTVLRTSGNGQIIRCDNWDQIWHKSKALFAGPARGNVSSGTRFTVV